jgi:hypothetical protein
MERDRRLATWIGAILGVFFALLLNSVLAHARQIDAAQVTREFHRGTSARIAPHAMGQVLRERLGATQRPDCAR